MSKRAKSNKLLQLNEAEISQIEALAVHGHTQQEISDYLGSVKEISEAI